MEVPISQGRPDGGQQDWDDGRDRKESRGRMLRRTFWLLVLLALTVGVALTVIGVRTDVTLDPVLHDVATGLGLSLLSAGLTTFAITYFGTELLEDKMIGAVRDDVHDQLLKLRESFKEVAPLYAASSRLGIESAYLTRTEALKSFARYLAAELKRASDLQEGGLPKGEPKEPARIWLVSSSMKWFLSTTMDNFDGRRLITSAANFAGGDHPCLDLRILMTHPERGDERAIQERRRKGAIPAEIEENRMSLKDLGVSPTMVRLYGGTPTVFAIATSEVMLLNPYPYGTEAYRCYCLVVRRTPEEEASPSASPSDIYRQYQEHHFEIPWRHAIELDENWQPSLPLSGAPEPSPSLEQDGAGATDSDGERPGAASALGAQERPTE